MSNRAGFFMLMLIWGACQDKAPQYQDTLGSGVIRIAVDQALEPLLEAEINVFEAQYARAGILPDYTNETEVVNMLLRDSVRLAVTTRGLTAEELESFHSRKFFPEVIKIATDGIALIVNRVNPDSLINLDMLQKLLTGSVKSWDELYPGSRLGDFRVVFDHPGSGAVRYMVDSVCRGQRLSAQCFALGSNQKVIDYVSHTPSALGIIGVNWISNPQDPVSNDFMNEIQVMRVGRSAVLMRGNTCQPYPYYLYTNEYPLIRNVYILLNDPRSGLPTGFTSFVSGGRGQRIVLSTGLLPATMPVRVVNIKD